MGIKRECASLSNGVPTLVMACFEVHSQLRYSVKLTLVLHTDHCEAHSQLLQARSHFV